MITDNHFTVAEQAQIFKAIAFAAEKHTGHWRKGTPIPYITHLMNVMKILCEHKCSAAVVVAGILHDSVEDTETTIGEIRELFGETVAILVAAASEKNKLELSEKGEKQEEAPWRQRKEETINHLKTETDPEKLLVCAADKLDNIRSMRYDYEKLGDRLWKRFNAGKEDLKWYYHSLSEALNAQGKAAGGALKEIAGLIEKELPFVFP